jgi:6-phosphogluconolactonase (cycloisomerase 2 family)
MCDRRFRLGWLVGFVVLLAAFARPGDARITFVQEDGIEDGRFEYSFIGDVVVSPDDRFLYTTTGYSPNQILVFAIAPDTGRIDERAQVSPTPENNASILAISADGHHLYSLDYGSGQIVVFGRDASTGLLSNLQTVPSPTTGFTQWQGMTVSPDGAHVYTTSVHLGTIGVYARDSATGLLTLVAVESGFPGLSAPVAITVSPDGANVYVACFRIDGAVVVLARDPITGRLSSVQDIEDGDGGAPLKYQFAVAVAPAGGQVYVAGRQGITTFTRDATTGVLTRVDATLDGSDHEVVLSRDGSRAYGCGSVNGLRGYARDATTGLLTGDEQHLPGDEGFGPPAFCFGMTMTSDARRFYAITSYDIDQPVQTYFYTIGVFRRLNVACSGTPLSGCHTPLPKGGSSVLIRGGTSNRASWKLRAAGSPADIGDPVGSPTDSALCVYDDRGSALGAFVPGEAPCANGSPCWQLHAPLDVRYTDSRGSREGVKLVRLQERPPGVLQIKVDARGAQVPLPSMPMVGAVTVQLQTSNGTSSSCWSATYATPRRNLSLQYRATYSP